MLRSRADIFAEINKNIERVDYENVYSDNEILNILIKDAFDNACNSIKIIERLMRETK